MKSKPFKDHFDDPMYAEIIMIQEIRKAIAEVWNNWGVGGEEMAKYYNAAIDYITIDIVKKLLSEEEDES